MAYQRMKNAAQHPSQSRRTEQWRRPALLGAAALAASFLYVRSKACQAEAEHPPQGQFIEVDGVRLHYLEQGSGPPLVMLHGNGILANDFDTSGLLDEAAGKYRVIAFDRPGYGYSERPRTTLWTPAAQAKLIHKALQQIGIEQPIVLGHSWGTLVALSMALDFPHAPLRRSGRYRVRHRRHASIAAGAVAKGAGPQPRVACRYPCATIA